jgi:8-oxo-dGTP pyrophosphatase MutT (NUDIX family)
MTTHPTQILYGQRIARQGKLRLGCAAILFDQNRQELLLTRRSDNGQWCLPGGIIEPGETISEACEREVREETGLKVKVERITGVYSNPDQMIVYPDDNKAHVIVLSFEVSLVGGKLGLCNETTDIRYFLVREAINMDLFHSHAEFIRDALTENGQAFIC